MRILILGISGMLGNAMFRYFSGRTEHGTYGTLRSRHDLSYFPAQLHDSISCGIDVLDHDGLIKLFSERHPDIVINCVGLIKQLSSANDPLTALPINSIFPHRLSGLCALAGARLVHRKRTLPMRRICMANRNILAK
jgi:dTDP-4-dehydrorhamnose reductase